MMDMPKTCPLTKGTVSYYKNDCAGCVFYIPSQKTCRIISIDENLKTLLAIIQNQQKSY